jgi:hypothetical protein
MAIRLLKDPLQAKLRKMEKKNPSITPKGTIRESLKFKKPFENVESVKPKFKSDFVFSESEKPGSNLGFEIARRKLEKIKYYNQIDLNASLRMLRDLANFGHPDYVVIRKEFDELLKYRFGKLLVDLPKDSKIRLFIENSDKSYLQNKK